MQQFRGLQAGGASIAVPTLLLRKVQVPPAIGSLCGSLLAVADGRLRQSVASWLGVHLNNIN